MGYPRCPTNLAAILAGIAERCGYGPTDYDFSAVADVSVIGYLIGQRLTGASGISTLLQVKNVSLVELDGQIRAVKNDGLSVADLPAADMGARDADAGADSGEGRLQITRLPDTELPFRVDITYFDVEAQYQQLTMGALRYTKLDLRDALTINTPITADATEMRQAAEQQLYLQWVRRMTVAFTLMPTWIRLAPSDIVRVPFAGGWLAIRLTEEEIAPFGPLSFTGVAHDFNVLRQIAPGGTFPTPEPNVTVTATTFVAWSGNALRDLDADTIGWYAAAAGATPGDWAGAFLYWSRDEGASYQPLVAMTDPAALGRATTALAAFNTTGLFDDLHTVDVTLTAGTLESTSDAEVLNGANAALVGDEVIQFGVATSLGPDAYRLSHLLRGRRGTDAFWAAHVSGERFVALDPGTIRRFIVPDDLYDRDILVKAVPENGQLASVPSTRIHITGNERKPYTATYLRGARQGNDDWSLSWIRRTRKGGAAGLSGPVPLSEAAEAYEVDILGSGSVVKRTLTNSVPTVTYTAAQQIADFGAVQATITFVVYQMGQYGRGYPKQATVTG